MQKPGGGNKSLLKLTCQKKATPPRLLFTLGPESHWGR